MPAATSKADLIAVTEKEFKTLQGLLQTLNDGLVLEKDEDDTSIKDLIGHRVHWIDLFFGWYKDGQAGKEVFFPAKGYKWNQLKAYNADLRERQADLGWADVTKMLEERHTALLAFMNEKSDTDLYGGPMKGAYNDWTPGRWAEAAGPSHYRSAAKYIRQRVKAQKG